MFNVKFSIDVWNFKTFFTVKMRFALRVILTLNTTRNYKNVSMKPHLTYSRLFCFKAWGKTTFRSRFWIMHKYSFKHVKLFLSVHSQQQIVNLVGFVFVTLFCVKKKLKKNNKKNRNNKIELVSLRTFPHTNHSHNSK